MANVTFMRTQHPEVVTSFARAPVAANIPVFNFSGELSAGLSGTWQVTNNIELTLAIMTAQTVSTVDSGIAIMRMNAFVPDGEVLKAAILEASQKKKGFSMARHLQPAIITPADTLYVAAFGDSEHQELTITLFGNII